MVCNAGIARLNANGTLDTSFDPGTGANDMVEGLALQPDGRVLIFGRFTAVNGITNPYVARLNANGSLDATFNPIPNGLVAAAALQPDGKILVIGAFSTVNGAPHDRIARLDADGALDEGFNPAAIVDNLTFKPYLQAIALQADGRIVIGGQFTHVGAVSRNRIVRLNADGSLDATFDPGQGPDKAITTVALQPDGKILVGGSFTNVANATRYYVARLNSDGSLDTTFNPNIALAYGGLLTVQVEADGKIFVAGDFAAIDGSSRNDIARLNPNGSLDTAFDPGTGPDTSSEVPRVRRCATGVGTSLN